MMPMKKLWDKAWDWISLFVRLQGADLYRMTNQCFTCEKTFPIKELQAGHFLHGKLDFDPRNLKPQCMGCNYYNGGQRIIYTIKLVKKYGLEWVEQLRRDAAEKGNDYSRLELEQIIQKYEN